MCLEEAQETGAKLSLWNILIMEMKMSKQYARGCLGMLGKVPSHQESWAVGTEKGAAQGPPNGLKWQS